MFNCACHYQQLVDRHDVPFVPKSLFSFFYSLAVNVIFMIAFTFNRRFCPVIHTYIHTLTAMAAVQGADQHIRGRFGVQYLADQGDQTSDLPMTRRWLYTLSQGLSLRV